MLAFGKAAEVLGWKSRTLELPPGATVAALTAAWRAGEEDAAWRYAVNQRYVAADHALQPGDELAIIPPVSGG